MTAETRALAPRTALDVDDAAAAKRTAQLMKHRGGLFDKDMTEPQAATLARLSLFYGLDPFTDDLILYQGRPYLTLQGAMRIANQDPQYDGIECTPATPDEREAFRARDDEALWVARVWRKDRRVPNVGYGRASGTEADQPVARKWTAEMAQKRAKHRALRDAFSLPVPGVEENREPALDTEPLGPIIEGTSREPAPPRADAPEPIRRDQIVAIHAIATAIGWISRADDTPYREALHATFGAASSKDLTANQAAAFIEALVAEQEDMITGDRDAAPAPGAALRLRDLVRRMDDGEARDWPTPAAPSTLAQLRTSARELGLTDLQLAGLIAAEYGEGVGLEHLDERQARALLAMLVQMEAPA
jgi:hypothetical protein